MRALKISEFKAKCLAVVERVDRTGEPVTILKRGRPVARLVPAASSDHWSLVTAPLRIR